MRNFGSCKCGNVSAFGSDPPPACDPCEKCGTVPGGREPIAHDFVTTKVETDEGKRFLTRCIRCTKRKHIQEDNNPSIEIAKLKEENAKLRTALMELEDKLHSSELEAMTAWSLLEEANKKMEDDQSLPTTATDRAMCPKCGTSHTAKQVLEFSTEWFPGTHTIACRQCREDFSITCVPAAVISPPREVKL